MGLCRGFSCECRGATIQGLSVRGEANCHPLTGCPENSATEWMEWVFLAGRVYAASILVLAKRLTCGIRHNGGLSPCSSEPD